MKLLLNTVTDPHFACLVAASGAVQHEEIWNSHKADGIHLHGFLAQLTAVTEIIALTGPAGYSSIRATQTAISAVLMRFPASVYNIKADEWARQCMLKTDAQTSFLRSFGANIFLVNTEKMELISLEKAHEIASTESVWSELLPEEFEIKSSVQIAIKERQIALLECARSKKSDDKFQPYYHFPAVESPSLK